MSDQTAAILKLIDWGKWLTIILGCSLALPGLAAMLCDLWLKKQMFEHRPPPPPPPFRP